MYRISPAETGNGGLVMVGDAVGFGSAVGLSVGVMLGNLVGEGIGVASTIAGRTAAQATLSTAIVQANPPRTIEREDIQHLPRPSRASFQSTVFSSLLLEFTKANDTIKHIPCNNS
jgi:hypothetical protein